MRRLALAAAILAGLPLAAHATLTVTATDNGNPLTFTPTVVGAGILDGFFTDANFSSISVSITGVPAIPSPDLGTVSLQLSSGPNYDGAIHIIDLTASQDGLAVPAGSAGELTQTFNNLITTPVGSDPAGPTTENFIGNGSVVLSHTFAQFPARSDSNTVTDNNLPAIFSDGEEFISTFTAGGQQLELTQEFVAAAAAPEPASLALFGAGLFGLGFIRYRRQ